MGQRITQIIHECSICGTIPEDGEHMWHMCGETWCEPCCNEDIEKQEDE